jgi:hypothetical protein
LANGSPLGIAQPGGKGRKFTLAKKWTLKNEGGKYSLLTFTFRQVTVKAMEIQAMPGPEARAWRGKIMRPR